MIRNPLLAALAGSLLLAVSAVPTLAQGGVSRPKAVVELFTSQGCSSCPPADALLAKLAQEGDVVALAYHVDYWDYVGWEDTFGSEDYSDRQRAYAKSWGSSRIYTPQMVVNGAKGVVGSKGNEVHRALDGSGLPLSVTLSEQGDMLKVSIPAEPALGDAVVWVVTYKARAPISIERGENAGKTMIYTQVVTDRQALGMWEGATGTVLKLPLDEMMEQGSNGIAVLVQRERDGLPGPILGAASFEP
jgi:hypothetical protein